MQNQQKDKELIKIAQTYIDLLHKNFMEPIRNIPLSVMNRKIVIPKQLEKQAVEWYHNAL